ncbi:MAG: 5-(carboxyamino)imidazole ribonucleotide synthase [Luteimonas sp.]
MTTVGILGGGQLARMLALAGAPLGLRFLVMDTVADACAGQFAPLLVGDYRDTAALAEFASRIDVATFDFENVPAESAQWLSARVPVFPNPGALAIAQDRLAEKTLFRELGIPVPAFADIATRAQLDAAIAEIGVPCILKTRRLGYDGKGQFRIKEPGFGYGEWGMGTAQTQTQFANDAKSAKGTQELVHRTVDVDATAAQTPDNLLPLSLRPSRHSRTVSASASSRAASPANTDAAWHALGPQVATVGLILEAFVPFERELSVVAARGRDGQFQAWSLTENWHVDGVLSASLSPARVDDALNATAFDYARRLADRLDYTGVFALELFCRDGQLLANELAPRVHNSGHWTIEGAETSQFENHLRAVLGLPLGATRGVGHACMLNWIGARPDALPVLREAGGHWHDYGKSPRDGRKVGHATLRAESADALADTLQRVGTALGREAQVAPVIARLRSPVRQRFNPA